MKIPQRQRTWLYSAFSVLYFSGIWWCILRYLNPAERFYDDSQFLKTWSLKVHGAAAMLALILLGTLIPTHIKKGWLKGINRLSGSVFIGVNVILIFTGYGLYYFGGEISRGIVHWLHIVLGIAFPGFLIGHILKGRSLQKSHLKKSIPK